MNDFILVAVPDGIDNLPQKYARLNLSEALLLGDVVIKLAPSHELHDDIDLPGLLNDLVDVDDVRVVQSHQDLYLVPHHVDGAVDLSKLGR